MTAINLKLYDILRKDLNLSEDRARDFAEAIVEAAKEKDDNNSVLNREFVKDERHKLELKIEQTKGEVTKAIFWAGLIQFLAIVGSVIGFVSFMIRK